MRPDSLYCGKWKKISKSRCDLDLCPAMPNIELVQIFSYTTLYSNFIFIDRLHFELSCKNTEIQKHRNHTHTQRDTDEYSIVAFCKNTTIFKNEFKGKTV